MKKWLPTGKALGFWITAIALAMWSLPNTPDAGKQDTPAQGPGSAIPTMAAPADSTTAVPVTDGNSAPVSSSILSVTQATSDSKPTPGNRTQPKPKATPAPRTERPKPTPEAPKQPAPSVPKAQPAPGPSPAPVPAAPDTKPSPTEPLNMFSPYVPEPTARLRLRVIDGRTLRPLSGAEVVIIETEQRLRTGDDGFTEWADVPIIRNPRYRPMVAELHGQLGAIAYKNGYRDSVHLGIRMHKGLENESTIWMYKLGPGDQRIEPVLYQVPYHHIWLVELADKFRSKTQPGEGPERP